MADKSIKVLCVGKTEDRFIYRSICGESGVPIRDTIRTTYYVDKKHKGPNVDLLNPWYCELTGLFALWTNHKAEIGGLEHYRTYLSGEDTLPIQREEVLDILSDSDIILSTHSYPAVTGKTIYDEFVNSHLGAKEFYKLLDTIDHLNLEGYEGFTRMVENKIQDEDVSLYGVCNCFIANRTVISEWCNFLFKVLLKFDTNSGLHLFNLRRNGYISEMLFGLWVDFVGYEKHIVPLIKYDKNITEIEQVCVNSRIPLLWNEYTKQKKERK